MPTHAPEVAPSGKRPVRRSAALASTPPEPVAAPSAAGLFTPASILGMQSSMGNAAVVRKLRREGLISTGQLAENLQQARDSRPGSPKNPGARFRLPEASAIQTMLTAGKVPEDKLKAGIEMALTRMEHDKALATSDSVAVIMGKIFPSPGKFDEKEFEKVVDVKNRSRIYKAVADAETRVSATDKPKLEAAMDDAVTLIEGAIADTTGLVQVFGTQADLARNVYRIAKARVRDIKNNLDTSVETDYNRDDEQMSLGGWADYSSQYVHLARSVAEVADKDRAAVTIVHECAHLANRFVDDRGYYASPGFVDLSENIKVANAAHYEELPRRIRKISSFDGQVFKPKAPKAQTFQEKVTRKASEYLRKAWDKAVDVHAFLRSIRKDLEAGDDSSFKSNKTRVLEVSKLEHLTIHQQAAPSTVEMIDIILSEGIARGTKLIQKESQSQSVPATPDPGKTEEDHVDLVVDASIKAYGKLTGNDADDKTLMEWLVKEYRKSL